MNPSLIAYGALGIAILCELVGTAFLQKTEQFTRPMPTLAMAACYAGAFYFLSHALKVMPLGVAYALWSGVGIVLIAVVGVVLFRQPLDLAAVLGIAMIVGGVVVMQTFSATAGHQP